MKIKKIMSFVMISIMVIGMFGNTHTAHAVGGVEPALGQIALFALDTAPRGWVECDGRSMVVWQNQALYRLIGNAFGGNSTSFNVPDLRSKSPVVGTKFYMATMGTYGSESAYPAIGEVCLIPDRMVSSSSTVWKLCDGSALSSASYMELFSLIGTTYGGNQSSFNIPNLSTKNPISGVHYYIATSGAYPTTEGFDNDAYIGSIDLYAFAFTPGTTLYCNGQSISSNTYNGLYNVIGNKFGGDSSNFKVPNTLMKAPILKMRYCIRTSGIDPSSY